MLHIVNGDSVANKLRQNAVQDEVLAWRDIFSFGPVFLDMENAGNRSIRAEYLERTLGIPQEEYLNDGEQESILRNLSLHEEVVLWFEHDLFDQTMLGYLLHRISKLRLGSMKLSLLCIGAFPGIDDFRGLGQLTVEQLGTLAGTWTPVTERELAAGSRLWEAYSSSLLEEHIRYLGEDSSALPFAKAAFEAHLSRLPSVFNGLGQIEQTTLETVAAEGVINPHDLFDRVSGRLAILGMGDLEYWYRLKRLTQEPYACLRLDGVSGFPDYSNEGSDFQKSVISLTELGLEMLEGAKDRVALAGIDEWVGGLRLSGRSVAWRWDRQTVGE